MHHQYMYIRINGTHRVVLPDVKSDTHFKNPPTFFLADTVAGYRLEKVLCTIRFVEGLLINVHCPFRRQSWQDTGEVLAFGISVRSEAIAGNTIFKIRKLLYYPDDELRVCAERVDAGSEIKRADLYHLQRHKSTEQGHSYSHHYLEGQGMLMYQLRMGSERLVRTELRSE